MGISSLSETDAAGMALRARLPHFLRLRAFAIGVAVARPERAVLAAALAHRGAALRAAPRGRQLEGERCATVLLHELGDPGRLLGDDSNKNLASIEGYEYYGALANSVEKHGIEKFNNFLADLQIWGRPEEVVEKLKSMVDRFDVGSFIIYTQFGDMPFEVGRDNYELFARKVLPHLKDIDVSAPTVAPAVASLA